MPCRPALWFVAIDLEISLCEGKHIASYILSIYVFSFVNINKFVAHGVLDN